MTLISLPLIMAVMSAAVTLISQPAMSCSQGRRPSATCWLLRFRSLLSTRFRVMLALSASAL